MKESQMKNGLIIIAGLIIILASAINASLEFRLITIDEMQKIGETISSSVFGSGNSESFVDLDTAHHAMKEASVPNLKSIELEVKKTPSASAPLTDIEDMGFVPLQMEQTDEAQPEDGQVEVVKEVIPVRIVIPAISLDAPIALAENEQIEKKDATYTQWSAPDEFAAGWHTDSAYLGMPGNTVLNGHHNVHGEVFANLDELVEGDRISVFGSDLNQYYYVISNVMILPERDVSFEEKLSNARWIMPSNDERLTLITCWPHYSNTHRLIIVAQPAGVKIVPLDVKPD